TSTVSLQGIGVATVLRDGGSTSVDFGDVDEGSSFAHLIGVTNSADAAVGLSGIGLAGIVTDAVPTAKSSPSPLRFDTDSVDGFTITSTTCQTTLDPGESCVIAI